MTSPLLVFSHLRWKFVYQRPQHVVSPLARDWNVFFIEEPQHSESEEPHWEIVDDPSGVKICVPYTPIDTSGFCDDQISTLRKLLQELKHDFELEECAAWTYTPMAWPLLCDSAWNVLVYDCMDELSKFWNAPKKLLENEQRLLDACDLVFTGGPSLYRAKKDRHSNVHCFSSSVDASHFAKAAEPGPDPIEQRPIPHPRLGFFGVIDERIDLPLLESLADSRPALVPPTISMMPFF